MSQPPPKNPHGPVSYPLRLACLSLFTDILKWAIWVEENKGRVIASSSNSENEESVYGRMLQIDHPPIHMSLQENCQELLTPLDMLPAGPPDSLNNAVLSVSFSFRSPFSLKIFKCYFIFSKIMAILCPAFNNILFITISTSLLNRPPKTLHSISISILLKQHC